MASTAGAILMSAAGWSIIGASAYALEGAPPANIEHRTIQGVSPTPQGNGVRLSAEDIEDFLDGFMASGIADDELLGATIAVSKGSDVIFAKGYGYADFEARRPVDIDESVFRIGSVTKLFTWTAVMQLVEQGKIDLDADVNDYLKSYKVPETFAQPVTMRNLMTHSAGFEDGGVGYLFVRSPEEFLSLEDNLSQHAPARVRPPTTDFANDRGSAYSNWGASLAGLVVQDIVGEPYDAYVARNIFAPLGMDHTTFEEPIPASLAANQAYPYRKAKGTFVREPFSYNHNFHPAGAISSTAADMIKFAKMHLGEVEPGSAAAGVLQPGTRLIMQKRSLAQNPYTNGTALGFYETWMNGVRTISHAGTIGGFRTELVLIPQEGVSYFISFNTSAGGRASSAFKKAFMDRYFPATLPNLNGRKSDPERLSHYVGDYRMMRRSYTKFDKVMNLFSGISVKKASEDHIYVKGLPGATGRFVEVKEGVFRALDDGTMIAFEAAPDGKTYLFGAMSIFVSDKVNFQGSSALHYWIIIAASLSSVAFLIRAPFALFGGKQGLKKYYPAESAVIFTGAVTLIFLMSFLFHALVLKSVLRVHIPDSLKTTMMLPYLLFAAAAALSYFAIIAWRRNFWTLRMRVFCLAACISYWAFLWSLSYWNLIGPRFG